MSLSIENKEKWITALRSGKYKQGRNQLYNPSTDQYYCLGVLAHGCLNFPKKIVLGVSEQNAYTFLNENGLEGKTIEKLWSMNDGTVESGKKDEYGYNIFLPPKSFNEIADWIEVNL